MTSNLFITMPILFMEIVLFCHASSYFSFFAHAMMTLFIIVTHLMGMCASLRCTRRA
jgi:uncharacterized membrane protein YqgA involved in biofilm formation